MFFLCPADKNKKNKRPDDQSLVFLVAEREGFEPPEQLPVHRISSAARSTTPASFRDFACKVTLFFFMCKGLRAFFLINGENKIFFVTLPVVLPPPITRGKARAGRTANKLSH